MGAKVERDRDFLWKLNQATEQALRIVARVRRRAIPAMDQRPRQVELRAVDREQAVSPPRGRAGGTLEDLGMHAPEHVLIDLGSRPAHRRCGDGIRLWKHDTESAALFPEFGKRGRVALVAAGQHQPVHEQHHKQRMQNPPPHLPHPVMLGRHRRQCPDEIPPERHEGIVRSQPGPPRTAPRRAAWRAMQENLPEVLGQRINIDPFRRLPLAAPGLAEIKPVRRTVAGTMKLTRIHKRFHQNRAIAVALLPVVRQATGRDRQRLGSQVPHPNPRKQQEPVVSDHPVQMLPVALRPANPRVPALQLP